MTPIPEQTPVGRPDDSSRVNLRQSRGTWLLGGALVLVAAGLAVYLLRDAGDATAPGAVSAIGAADIAAAEFVGSERCADCHAEEFAAWRSSQHRAAMQPVSEQTVLGDFDGTRFDYNGVTTRFERRDGSYFISTDGPDGRQADYPVKYAFGVFPLQQYLLELPRGYLQAFSVAWDSHDRQNGGQRWFHLYPDERVDHRDELHWTRRSQNWNYMCADCHSTNVAKGYDAASDTYRTTYSEVSVGCEACHGPGSAHLRWAARPDASAAKGLAVSLDERRGVSWSRDPATGQPRRSAPRSSEREIDVCAQCHARRTQIADGYRAGKPFLDHYLPALPTPPLYHLDGQQRDEVFIWGSWLQSRMHAAGVTCSDCHDPHTQKLRTPGNAVCAQCHDASRYDTTAHHHHPPNQPSAQCVACHMPAATYMVVDPRRDHSMRVPRPDLTVSLGVPNACGGCHRESSAQWAVDAVRRWYGRDAVGFQSFAPTFAAADSGQPRAAVDLAAIAFAPDQPPIVRAAALEMLARQRGRNFTEAATRAAIDAAPLVRLAAARLGESLPSEARATALAPLLADPLRAVRIEAARVLAGAEGALPEAAREQWAAAAAEYQATLQYNADRPESNVALGTFEAARGNPEPSRAAFARALQLDPQFVPAYVNEADVLRAAGREQDALAILRQGIAQAPENAALHHALGLAQVRLQQRDAALESLGQAARLDPGNARYVYVYAVALGSSGQVPRAIAELRKALQSWPHDRDLLVALASFELESGDAPAALETAAVLLKAYPNDPDGKAIATRAAAVQR
jgi:tetratricopeptide (TPR) repeat protein